MFDKMKELMEIQKKAKEVQKTLDTVRIEKTSPGGKVKIVMNGNHRVEELVIDESILAPAHKADLEKALVKVITDAAEDVKKESAAMAMSLMKGFKLPGM